MNANTQMIIQLSDGKTSAREIASKVGLSSRYVRKVMKKFGCPMLPVGPPRGEKNPSWNGGRTIDKDGYALIRCDDPNHPYIRRIGAISEHRFLMEQRLGRYLDPKEVVDHIDGLKLHNSPDNLRLFESNGAHLAETIGGKSHNWSKAGMKNIGTRTDLGKSCQPVDTYRLRTKAGDEALLQTLLILYVFGKDSPFLLGTNRLLAKRQIDPSSRTMIIRELDRIKRQYEIDLSRWL